MYIAHTDAELKAELDRLKGELRSVITKWEAGDTSVEKTKNRVEQNLRELVAEIQQRPSLAALIQRQRETTSVAAFY